LVCIVFHANPDGDGDPGFAVAPPGGPGASARILHRDRDTFVSPGIRETRVTSLANSIFSEKSLAI
jgi:hypothetical protein